MIKTVVNAHGLGLVFRSTPKIRDGSFGTEI